MQCVTSGIPMGLFHWQSSFQLLITWNPSIYNIIRWVAWTMGQTNRRQSVWCSKYYFFFMISCKILCKNPFNFFSYFFFKIKKIKIKSFDCPKSIKSIKRNNTWNIRLLVDNSFVPSSKQPSVIYCRLTDLMTEMADWRQSLPFSILSKL